MLPTSRSHHLSIRNRRKLMVINFSLFSPKRLKIWILAQHIVGYISSKNHSRLILFCCFWMNPTLWWTFINSWNRWIFWESISSRNDFVHRSSFFVTPRFLNSIMNDSSHSLRCNCNDIKRKWTQSKMRALGKETTERYFVKYSQCANYIFLNLPRRGIGRFLTFLGYQLYKVIKTYKLHWSYSGDSILHQPFIFLCILLRRIDEKSNSCSRN